MNNEELHQLEVRLSSNIELLKYLKKYVCFNNQNEVNLSENDSECISFIDVLEDLEDIRNELDLLVDHELAKELPY